MTTGQQRVRVLWLGLGGLLALSLLAGRLYQMQILSQDDYLRRADRNSLVIEPISAPRGRILDSQGRILVGNSPQFELVAIPAEMKDRSQALPALAKLLGEPVAVLGKRLREAPPLAPLVLSRDLHDAALASATQVTQRHRGLMVRSGAIRRYRSPLASHLLGYVGEITSEEIRDRRQLGYALGDGIGKVGLEKQYDLALRGHKGSQQVHIDVLGRTVAQQELRPSTPGADLYLNLDLDLQTVVESALAETLSGLWKANQERSGGAVVVMGAQTGEIKAMASLPGYDPRPFSRGIRTREYQALLEDQGYPLVNRLSDSSFSPGSTFKMITASAALQEGYCQPHSVFYCGGSFGEANCFVTSGHGTIGFEDSMAHSCDVVYYQLGHTMGIDTLRRYCADFGLGRATGIDLPGETEGLLPSPTWKEREWQDEWYDGDTVNMSIGQGFLLVSPLQMAVVTAAVANGGRVVQPRLARKLVARNGALTRPETDDPRQVAVDAKFLAAVRRGMRGAVTHGTAVAADSPHVRVAGKTGTVENSPSVHNRHGRNHVWFVSFAPYENPEFVCVVFLEKSHGYGGGLAAPIARKVYDHLYSPKPEVESKPKESVG